MGTIFSVTKNLTVIRRQVVKMERKWIVGLSLIALCAILIAGVSIYSASNSDIKHEEISGVSHDTGDVAGSQSYQIDIKTKIPLAPEKILIFKTNPPIVNKETTLTLAKTFKVNGTLRGDCVIQSDDLVYGLEILKISGKVRYSNAKRPNETLDSISMLPSEDDAIRIANDFLKNNNLLPSEAKPGKASYNYVMFSDKEGNYIPRYGSVTVGFGRELNNLELKGAGVAVTIGGNGDIIGYSSDWRNYTPYKEYPLKSPEFAYDELKKQGIRTGIQNPGIVSINEVYLAYKQKAPAFKEEYLEPVWVFKGQTMTKDSKEMPVTEYIPALTDDSRKSLSFS